MTHLPTHLPPCEDCVSVQHIDFKLPANIVLCSDGTVREIFHDGREVLVEPEFNSNGTAYLEFMQRGGRPGETFKFWVGQGMYRAHCGPISKEERVVHIDGDRKNLHPSNLALEPKPVDELQLVRKKRPTGHRFLD
jgi:hypothetical protein